MWPISDSKKTDIFPYITLLIVFVNIAVFFLQLLSPDQELIIERYALIPSKLIIDPSYYYTLLTSAFLHGSFIHLFSNVWYLWIFGDNLEAKLGRIRFILFYLSAAVFASSVQAILMWGDFIAVMGASGAISGVLGYYSVAFPQSKIRSFLIAYPRVGIYEIRAKYLLTFWFVLQFISSVIASEYENTQIAWGAHIAGFMFGIGVYYTGRMLELRRKRPEKKEKS